MAVTSDAGIDAADRTALKDVLVRLREVPSALSTQNDHKTERFICVLSDAKSVVPTSTRSTDLRNRRCPITRVRQSC